MRTNNLRLFGREYCSLCTEMRTQLASLEADLGVSVEWVDIDDDDELEDRYSTMVPVLVGEGDEVICFYHLSLLKLNAYLDKKR